MYTSSLEPRQCTLTLLPSLFDVAAVGVEMDECHITHNTAFLQADNKRMISTTAHYSIQKTENHALWELFTEDFLMLLLQAEQAERETGRKWQKIKCFTREDFKLKHMTIEKEILWWDENTKYKMVSGVKSWIWYWIRLKWNGFKMRTHYNSEF